MRNISYVSTGKNEYSEILNPILEYNRGFFFHGNTRSHENICNIQGKLACFLLLIITLVGYGFVLQRFYFFLHFEKQEKIDLCLIHGHSQTMDIRRKGKALVCGGKNTLFLIDNFTDSPVSLAENSDMQTAVMECFYNSFVVYKCDFTKQTRTALELLLEGY